VAEEEDQGIDHEPSVAKLHKQVLQTKPETQTQKPYPLNPNASPQPPRPRPKPCAPHALYPTPYTLNPEPSWLHAAQVLDHVSKEEDGNKLLFLDGVICRNPRSYIYLNPRAATPNPKPQAPTPKLTTLHRRP
jgi:hypothetical protein